MTYDEAIVAAQLELPVKFTRIDGCERYDIECKKIVKVGYSFTNGRKRAFVEALDKQCGCAYHVGVEDVRLTDPIALEGWFKKDGR